MSRAHIVGVSIPRSGHHFLVRLLHETFGADFRYCEFYTADACCRSVPCTSAGDAAVFFQKNHDFDLTLPSDLPGVIYAVQHRDPVMSLLSDREYLATMDGEARATDHDAYVVWLGRKASYYERFFDKWLRPPRPGDVRISYDELSADPAGVLERLCAACGRTVSAKALAAAAARAAPERAAYPLPAGGLQTFVPRDMVRSRFFDPALLSAIESLLLDRIPELAAQRRLERVAYEEQPVACVYFAEDARRRGDHAAALAHIDRALVSAPRNAHLHAERCDLLCTLERLDEALDAAREALALRPADAAMIRRLSDVHALASRHHLISAQQLAARLVEQSPEDPGSRVHLAFLLLQLGRNAEAELHANRALQLGARDPDVWRGASEVFASRQNWPAAIEAVRGAIKLLPAFPEYHHHLANLLTLAGRPADAIEEHRCAVALAPDRPGWRWRLADDLRLAGRDAEALAVVRDALTVFPDFPPLQELAALLTRSPG